MKRMEIWKRSERHLNGDLRHSKLYPYIISSVQLGAISTKKVGAKTTIFDSSP